MAGSGLVESPEPRPPDKAAATITLNLIVRFSHPNIADVSLPLELPDKRSSASIAPSVNNLKAKLRPRLPGDFPKHGLKLIYSGRVLHGLESVEKALKLDVNSLHAGSGVDNILPKSPHVDFQTYVEEDYHGSTEPNEAIHDSSSPLSREKGKAKAHSSNALSTDGEANQPLLQHANGLSRPDQFSNPAPTIYLHCAVTPAPLDPSALAAQRTLESELLSKESEFGAKISHLSRRRLQSFGSSVQGPAEAFEPNIVAENSQPDEQPRGFDRLLAPSSGFSAVDVQALRSQFRYVIGSRYTPDTMPSPTSLLRMEEAWLDDSSYSVPGFSQSAVTGETAQATRSVGSNLMPLGSTVQPAVSTGQATAATATAATATAATATGGYTDDDAAASLDDTYIGVFIGFFWPLGACVWGLREEGIWSRRRGRAVMAGILINLLFGVVKVLG